MSVNPFFSRLSKIMLTFANRQSHTLTWSLRGSMSVVLLAALVVTWTRTDTAEGGQAAISLSLPGQEDLTFWVSHNGLDEIDVEGEVGFGDMARILMRRRANAQQIQALRDHFTFPRAQMSELQTPDVFRVKFVGGQLTWVNKPDTLVVAQGRIFNVPLIVENGEHNEVALEAHLTGVSGLRALESHFGPTRLPGGTVQGYFVKLLETSLKSGIANLSLRVDDQTQKASIAVEVRPLVQLRVKLIDEKGFPAAARVYLTASDGLAYVPRNHITRISAMGAEYYFHANDTFQLELPSGQTRLEVTRGLEYELTSRSFYLEPGRPQEVTVRLRRWENMTQRGWYSADSHIHANYTAYHHQSITPKDVRVMVMAEDLSNANMLVANSSTNPRPGFLHDLQYFDGRLHSLSDANHIIYWNEEMRNNGMYGHMVFWNLKRLVYPLYTGFAGTPHWEHYPPNYTQAKGAQDQGGAVAYAHPSRVATFDGTGAKEMPVDVALGQIDAVDVISNTDEMAAMELWYRLLNCGFRIGISAGSDQFVNVVDHYTLGGGRVYVRGGQKLDYSEWIRNYKNGRSFATNGPIINLTVHGKGPGEELRFVPIDVPVKVQVKAVFRTAVPLEKVEVVVNGRVLISQDAESQEEVTIDEEVLLTSSSWIAARAFGPWSRPILNDLQAFAHTSPVYVYIGGQHIRFLDDATFYIDWIQRLISRVNERGRFANSERRLEVVKLFRKALEVYREIAKPLPEGA